MTKYAISRSPISGKIQIGRLNKAGTMFLGDKEYHTDEAVYVVAQHILKDLNGTMDLQVGDTTFHIEVTES